MLRVFRMALEGSLGNRDKLRIFIREVTWENETVSRTLLILRKQPQFYVQPYWPTIKMFTSFSELTIQCVLFVICIIYFLRVFIICSNYFQPIVGNYNTTYRTRIYYVYFPCVKKNYRIFVQKYTTPACIMHY